jgi:hypothetical protein
MIITDFERSAINAFSAGFPFSLQHRCFFHFSQAMWRQVQSLGYAVEYSNNLEFAINIRKLVALAFLPVEAVNGLGLV